MRVRYQPGQTRYQKNRIAQLVREPQVGADGRDGAVDVDRQRTVEPLFVSFEGPFADADEPHVLSLQLELQRHLKQPRRARIARVKAVTESRGWLVGRRALLDDRVRSLLDRQSGTH